MTVIGVVGNARHEGLDTYWRPKLYRPYQQEPARQMSVVFRTTTNPNVVLNGARRAVWEVDADLPVNRVVTMDELIGQSVAEPRFQTVMLSLLAGLAALLALVGVYGVSGYIVAQSTREIGIRVALGAARKRIVHDVLARSLMLAAAGLAIGATAAWLGTRVLDRFLFEVSASDPWLMLVSAFVLAAATLMASYLPAVRAAKVDPMVALRQE